MTRHPRLLTAAALLAAGCAGPQAHVTFGGKNEPLDVAFGRPAIVKASAPLAPVPSGLGVLPVTQPGAGHTRVIIRYVNGPSSRVHLPPPPPPPACPPTSPFSVPAAVAGDSVGGTVPNGTFPYRFSGRAIEGKTARDFSGIAPHVVSGAAIGNGSYKFSVGVTMLGATTTYSYLVVPGVSAVESVPGAIELAQVSGKGGFGYDASFHPDKPLQVFVQPAYTGEAWKDAETDATSGSVATIDGTIVGKDRVAACGTALDAWETTAVMTVTSPNETIRTTVSTWWATQFGGLPIQETQSYTGKAGGQPVKGTITSFIAVDPTKVKQ